MFLPLEQIIVPIGLTAKSREIPEKEVVSALLNLKENRVDHLGRRGAGRLSVYPLEMFILKTPPEQWEPLVAVCTANAFKRATIKLREEADLKTAHKEMNRIINGYHAEALYFDRDLEIVEEKAKIFQTTLSVMKQAKPVLDSVCFLRVRKHG